MINEVMHVLTNIGIWVAIGYAVYYALWNITIMVRDYYANPKNLKRKK